MAHAVILSSFRMLFHLPYRLLRWLILPGISLLIFLQPVWGQVVFWQKYQGTESFEKGKNVLYRPDGTLIITSEVLTGGEGTGQPRSYDVRLIKYSTQGKIFWERNLGGSGHDRVAQVIQTRSSGIMLIGTTESNDGDIPANRGGSDIWVVNLSPTGQVLWSRTFGGSGDERGTAILETSSGDIWIGGESASPNGDMQSLHHGGLDAWVARLSSEGRLLWERHYGSGGNEQVCRLHERPDGRIMALNSSDQAGQDVQTNLGRTDIWATILEDDGEISWQANFGGSDNDLLETSYMHPDGSLILGGTTFSADVHVNRHQGLGDGWLLRLDASGGLQWSLSFGGRRPEGVKDVKPTADGGYLWCGLTQSRTGEGDIVVNAGYYDGWVGKVDSSGKMEWMRTHGYAGKDVFESVLELPNGGYVMLGYSIQDRKEVLRPGHKGTSDVWLLNMSDPGRLGVKPFVTPPLLLGSVRDKATGRPVAGTVTLIDNKTMDSLATTMTNPEDGSFILLLPPYGLVSLSVQAKGYIFYGADIRMDSVAKKTSLRKDIKLEAIRIGSSLVLENIFFETGKWDLLPPSLPEMQRMVAFMDLNPRVQVLVSGHTDNTGNKSQKVQLSLNRAEAVKKYLRQQGIADNRLRTKGYGMYRPLAPNTNPAGRRKNRRVEFEVIMK